MEINLINAIPIFHPNPSYEQIYFEAVANAFDAGADEISINITIDEFERSETLELTIKDNGMGFTDKNFTKFSKLLEVEGKDHKGAGRLIYLEYFKTVEVESFYGDSSKRKFIFNESFKGSNPKDHDIVKEKGNCGSTLHFSKYRKARLYKYDYLIPQKIKESLIQQFFPFLFNKKKNGEKLLIEISLKVLHPSNENNFVSGNTSLTLDFLPELKTTTFKDISIDFYSSFDIHYSIEKNIEKERSVYTAVCIDNRAVKYDLIQGVSVPDGYPGQSHVN